MKALPVRLLDLATALEDHSRESLTNYFDTQSGEVVFLSEEMRGSDKRWRIISNSVGRFKLIEPMDSRKGYVIMEQFVEMLPPTPLREKLQWSLEGPKPFRRSRDALLQDPLVRERWFEFHGGSVRKIALEWLADHGVEPVEPTSPDAPSLLDRELSPSPSKKPRVRTTISMIPGSKTRVATATRNSTNSMKRATASR
jgi:hypothetical protein